MEIASQVTPNRTERQRSSRGLSCRTRKAKCISTAVLLAANYVKTAKEKTTNKLVVNFLIVQADSGYFVNFRMFASAQNSKARLIGAALVQFFLMMNQLQPELFDYNLR